ncbi:MAG: signal recognition particle protein [Zavarzinella sp.]
MFDGIQKGIKEALAKLSGRRLTEDNIREGLREVRRAFLEADVNFTVTNDFISKCEAKAIGEKVIDRVKPVEQIVNIVFEELVELMGPVDHRIPAHKDRPAVLMMCGLQGAGKTTTCGKLALKLQKEGRKPLLVAADLQRPAAIEQLIVLGQQLKIPVYSETSNPVQVCKNAITHAKNNSHDVVILDTAGRLQIDDALMAELMQIDKQVKPDQVYLVVDAMIGQEAVNVSKAFHEKLMLNGTILTKLDGDARGGAALSIKAVTGVQIKFIGTGEKLEALEDFRPESMASRIMGQGDLMGLVDKVRTVQQEISEEELKKQQEALEKGDFTIEMFRAQFMQIKKMGMKDMMSRMPGMSEMIPEGEDPEVAFQKFQGIIDSMTKKERKNPDVIDAPRRRRIAKGSGTEPHEVSQFLKQFDTVRGIMKQMMSMTVWQRMKMLTGLSRGGAFLPGNESMLKTKGNTGHRKSAKERAEERKKKKKKKK